MTEKNESANKHLDSAQTKLRLEAWNRLRGAFKEVYAEYGGGEAYLRQERESFNKGMERREALIDEAFRKTSARIPSFVMKDSTAFEQQVRRIYELIAESGAEVTWNDHIGDPDNPPRTRQIDVTLRRNGALTLVECRQHKAPQDVQWIECLIGRRISLGAQSVIAVSSSGFTAGALAKSRQYGIITRDLQRLTGKEVESWGQRIELTLYYYQYSDLEVSLGFSPESIPTVNHDALKAELRWHPCVQSLFNAAAKYLTEKNLMSGPLKGQKVNFGVDILFDDIQLGGARLERAALEGRAELVPIKADAPLVHAYGEPNTSSTQREAVVENFRGIGHTSITHSGDRISTFIDLSQVEIPPYGQFQFVNMEAVQEVDHDAFEIVGIEGKFKVFGAGLKVKVYSSADWPGLRSGVKS